MKLGLLGSTGTHRGTRWAPAWAFATSRYATTPNTQNLYLTNVNHSATPLLKPSRLKHSISTKINLLPPSSSAGISLTIEDRDLKKRSKKSTKALELATVFSTPAPPRATPDLLKLYLVDPRPCELDHLWGQVVDEIAVLRNQTVQLEE
ncbi:hypothetical protein E3N88_25761 [Mikania micrantha]|uniref:Uncharacterized protein n=1 Tax=Mikania micrantha TaxID=192012 RepID=A0A5N6N6L1_9ASTR|nr:hypothetical protein E3N88_25761 [Mikania micrantha]